MSTNKISEAVESCKFEICKAQAMLRALGFIQDYLANQSSRYERTSSAFSEIHVALYKELEKAWNMLSWLTPVSDDAANIIRERTKTWFQSKNTDVMSWLGCHGSYYVADEKAFRDEVLYILGCPDEGICEETEAGEMDSAE
jgi:hypothetical protein